ncbi:MAG TPA: glutathione S-transferase family protein [Caulobacteraceae bacterium]|nr:glutathione S-transferase family protein [Caulobacteraceae bacterium]
MSEEIILYRSVASRSYTALWMLEELGLTYRMETVDIRAGATRTPAYLAINPMGKVPTLKIGDVVVTEAPAICLFLADRYGYGTFAPKVDDPERGAYLRWSVFAASVLEPAMTLKARDIELPARQVGWGSFEDAVRTLSGALGGHSFIVGERMTAADVIVGSAVGFGLFNKMLPEEPALVAYNEAMSARPAQKKAGELTWPPELMSELAARQ